MTCRHARTVALAVILITLAPGVWVHARQELTPAAVAETHARAGQGDADAQYELGIMYAEGRGVPQNDAVAFAWYRQAAEAGVAAAQFNVGLMYSAGRGVPRDEAEAVTWYQQAAAQGLAEEAIDAGLTSLHLRCSMNPELQPKMQSAIDRALRRLNTESDDESRGFLVETDSVPLQHLLCRIP